MIWLIYGEDEYRLKQRVGELLKEGSDLNIVKFELPIEFETIKNEAETMAFLAERKIVVIKDVLASKDKELISKLEKWLSAVPKETDLIFVEKKIDQRASIIKSLQKTGKIEAYEQLKPFEIGSWVVKKTSELGGKITKTSADKLGLMIGNDLVRLENEIKKLIAYNPEITDEAIEKLVKAEFSQSIFALMDALSEKNVKKSVKLLDEFLENEENEIYLLSMFARQVRNLMIIKDLSSTGKTEVEIAGLTKLHPYVIKKTLSQTKNFSLEKLLKMHSQLLKADLELKSNNIEPKVLLTRLVISFAS